MCCIIFKPENVELDKELLEIRHKANSDSWGYTVLGKNGLDICKWKKEFDFRWIPHKQKMVIHFRTGTSGTKKDEGDQPIMINDVAVFHNGNFPDYAGKAETDTVLFCQDIIARLSRYFYRDILTMQALDAYAKSNHSKLVFMFDTGKVAILNQEEGVWEKGMWFSNPRVDDYAGFGFSGLYPYREQEIRYLKKNHESYLALMGILK